jgi:hypothetical protein
MTSSFFPSGGLDFFGTRLERRKALKTKSWTLRMRPPMAPNLPLAMRS